LAILNYEKNNKNLIEILNDRNAHIFQKSNKDGNNSNNIVVNTNKFERIADNNDIKRLINNNNVYIGNKDKPHLSKTQMLPSLFMNINDDGEIINNTLSNTNIYTFNKTTYNNV
jgi:hypothetical protein